MNLPNQLTVGRLILSALFVVVMSWSWPYAATTGLVVFLVASLTDWIDGEVARQRNQVTDLGKLLDPLADKVLVSAALISLVERHIAPMWMVVAIVSREFLITGLRIVAANRHVILEAERVGKHKTVTQVIVILTSLGCLSLQELGRGQAWATGILQSLLMPFYWLAVIITIFSGAIYFYKNRFLIQPVLEGKNEKPVSSAGIQSQKPASKVESIAARAPEVFPAFKEWGVIVEALGQGAQMIILRKGGIDEGTEGFSPRHKRFWLFPTEYHQQMDKTKPTAEKFARPGNGNDKEIQLQYYADVSDVRFVDDWEKIKKLDSAHLWQEAVVRERFDYDEKPGLHLLLVRVYRLTLPLRLPLRPEYNGCKSWIELPADYTSEPAEPVFSNEEFATRRSQLLARL
jgi:CDP-diacylglycerol--glycerol-3-phosphate 3-phosphatidyltransferase